MGTKRVVWKDGHIVSLKLRDDLYTLAQMLRSPYMRFFDVSSADGVWKDVDLNEIDPLFCVLVGRVVNQQLVDSKVKDPSVKGSDAAFERYWIRPYVSFSGGYPFKGGELVDVDPEVGYAKAAVVKADLSVEHDLKLIQDHELTNMWGADDLAARLITYFTEGEDRNPLKQKVFDGLNAPSTSDSTPGAGGGS